MVNTGQSMVKPVWDNAKRVNHQKISNKLKYPQARRIFFPSGVLTRTGLGNPVRPNGKRAVHTVSTARPISTARHISTARPVSTARHISTARPVSTASPFAPKIAQTGSAIVLLDQFTQEWTIVVNTGKGKMDNALKKLKWVWRPKGNYMDHESKEKGSFILKKFEYVDPKWISNGCSSHMTDNKAYLSDYEDYNGGFVAFGSDHKEGKSTD
ncbi:hypothetical protein Tco_1479696 [Tanacetum coccineum]